LLNGPNQKTLRFAHMPVSSATFTLLGEIHEGAEVAINVNVVKHLQSTTTPAISPPWNFLP